MKKLTEADVIGTMQEEWDKRVKALAETIGLSMDTPAVKDEEPIVAPGLKVRHNDSQIRYTVVSVSPRDVILKTPEGEQFVLDADDLEKSYILD